MPELAGELAASLPMESMADILRAAGLSVTVGRYSVRIEGHSHFVFQHIAATWGRPGQRR